MKKKLMMVAVLLGALSLGACVDDNESASVTAIRDAKRQQLESLANLNNANAEAIALAAQAEADLLAAKAAYQQAKADKVGQELEEAKQEFAFELEMLKAKYESEIAQFNAVKAYYDKELWGNVDAHISAVYSAYTEALGEVNDLTQTKLEQQVLKAQTEAGVITAEESVKQTLADLNIQKIQKERELAKLTAMKEAQPSKDEYLKMLDELETKAYDILNNQRPEAVAAENAAYETYKEAKEAVEEGDDYKFVAAAETLNQLATDYSAGVSFISQETENLAEDEVEAYMEENNITSASNIKLTNGTSVSFSVSAYNYVDYTVTAATNALKRAQDRELESKETGIENATGKAWEQDDDKNLIPPTDYFTDIADPDYIPTVNDAKSEQTYWAQQITAENKNISDLKEQLADAEEAEDEAEMERLESLIKGAENNIKTYTQNKEDAAVREMKANAYVKGLEEEKAEIEADQKTFTEQLAVLNDATAQKEYNDAVAALETPAVELIKAIAAVKPFNDQLEEMGFNTTTTDGKPVPSTSGDYANIKSLLDGIYDVQDLIDQCNTALARIEASLQLGDLNYLVSATTNRIYYYNPITDNTEYIDVIVYVPTANGGITPEDAVAVLDTIIKQLEEQIKAQQAIADQYKNELEALVNSSEDDAPAA